MRRITQLAVIAGISAIAAPSLADPPASTTQTKPADAKADSPRFNFPSKTLGGIQLWTDLRVQGDWRIQQNSETGHCRLLDPKNIRRGWGSYEQCESLFKKEVLRGSVKPVPEHVVLILHGLMGSRPLLRPLQAHLREQGLEAMCVSYASTRRSIDDHAKALKIVIERLGPNVKRIDFVGHSMGNIVLRRYLAMLPLKSKRYDQVGRIVMLAPPNRGAEIAKILKDNAVFQLVTGNSGQQLADFHALEAKLAIPKAPFGIVAGGGGTRNPLLSGDDDFFVGIDETKLPGASDFMVVDSLHRSLPKHPKTIEVTHRFLTRGYFQSENKRYRLPPLPRRVQR